MLALYQHAPKHSELAFIVVKLTKHALYQHNSTTIYISDYLASQHPRLGTLAQVCVHLTYTANCSGSKYFKLKGSIYYKKYGPGAPHNLTLPGPSIT